MYPPDSSFHCPIFLHCVKSHRLLSGSQIIGSGSARRKLEGSRVRTSGAVRTLLILIVAIGSIRANAQSTPPVSNRVTINLSEGVPNFVGNAATTDPTAALPQSNWWYENNQDSTTFATPSYVEVAAPASGSGPSCGSALSTPNWSQVGIPTDANIWRTFINQASGGGQGSLCGQNNWYRLHFKVDPKYANSKIMVEFEGAHTAIQIYINGTLLPGISAVTANAEASHVVGFIPVIADLTPYITADGATENVLAVSVSRGNSWFEDPAFSEVFRFGQAMAGLFRPIKMFITNKVHIPVNVYSNQKTWGTYVATVSEVPSANSTAQAASAVIQVETNVLNENTTSQTVTLATQIVDANGNVVAIGAPLTQTVAPMTPGSFPSTATPMFSQQITVNNPTLWYPNNSIYGTPYLYTVNHIVSVNGVVVDVAQSPLGIRTITWNTNYPIFNGYPMNLWGGSGRYDYPGLGSSVPEEQQWRDLSLLAAEGGNIYRPGHSTSSEEFVNAADAYGIMIDQPSGDNEEAFADPTADMVTLKEELHRDMIIRDRSHPSILDWESNNGTMEESVGEALSSINSMWDPINTRIAADRTPDPVNGYLLGCTLEGCEVGVKTDFPNNPAWGAEYWGTGTARGLAWNYELAFVAPFLDNWRQGKAADAMGMAQWYLADTPGETGQYIEAGSSTTAPGNSNDVRSLGASSIDQNRFPKLLYYVYEAAWTPFSLKPVVRLSGHWNLSSGNVQANAFSNCPSVELLVNGVQQGAIETPNPWDSDDEGNQTQTATLIPFQTSWIVPWVSGTVTAECLNASGAVVATDTRTTAGAENKIVLSIVPELTKPNGTAFQVTANGSDAAFVTATIEDSNGNWEPLASDLVTFSVTGPATYQGGTEQYVSTNTNAYSNANSTYIGGVPDAFYHSPGDPELQVEGGMTRIALRSQFTAGTVTVTATAPGLASGSVSFPIVAVPDPRTTINNCTTLPSAPNGFSATATSSSVITLTWSAVTPPANCTISFYNVYRSTTSGFTPSSSNEIASGITSASYSDTGLPDLTTYYYVVEAVDGDGTSAASAQVTATTPVTPPCSTVPPAPTGLTASATSSSAIQLTWTPVTPPANCTITSYNVYRSITSGFAPGSGNLIASGVTAASYSNTGLASETTYYFVVEALDSDGTSAPSTQASATTPPADIVSINAGGPAVSNSSGGDNSFVADEDFSTGGTTYLVTNTITIPTSVAAIAAPAAVYQDARQGVVTYTIPGLTAGTNYTVRLHFAELYFSATGNREFNVAINGTTVLANFDIYAAAGANYTAVVEQYIAAANSSGNIVIALTNGSANQPSINGIEILGNSSICSTVPSAPTGLTATASSSSIIGLTWNAVTPPANCSISSYSVYSSTSSGFTPSSSNLVASGVAGTTYSNTGLAASTTYYYKVEAVDLYGASAASAQASATTSATSTCNSVPPTGPTNLAATASSSSVINLSWTAAPANPPCTITSYSVYGSTTSGLTPSSNNLVASGVTGTTYSNTSLAASTTYYYVVEALDSFGTSAASAQASATTLTASSGTSIVSINAGGPAVSDSGGGDDSFVADEDYSTGGTTYSVTNTITIPANVVTIAAPAAVYQDARQGTVTYTIPGLTAGSSYTLRLHFAELYFSAAGDRVFNVAINGTSVLTNFDIYATAQAKYTAVVEQFTATANSSGQIVIAFTNGTVDQPMINGVEVLGSSTSCSAVPSAPTGLTANATSSSAIALSWTAVTPPANCSISGYSVYGSTTSGFTPSSSNLIASGVTGITYTNTGLTASTTYYYKVEAVDTDGSSAASAQASATTQAGNGGSEVVAIACGGPAESNSGGGDYSFVADEDFSGGGDNAVTSATINLTQPGVNAAPMGVYQHARAGVFTYTIPGLTAGSQHSVLLHFAETYFTAAGDREFNVAINGTTVLTNLDIYATVGVNAALLKTFTATANSSGQIVIAFSLGAANQPVVSGIEIR
jgi:beta-galactosidase